MKNPHAYFNDISSANWHILGDLELPVHSDANHEISSWLQVLLTPLNLHTDFQIKVLNSAQDAASRAAHAEPSQAFEHIHLYIFIPANRKSDGQTWGFFRIEKIENAAGERDIPDHAIELYLYLESQ